MRLEIARIGHHHIEVAVVVHIAPTGAHRTPKAGRQRSGCDFGKRAIIVIAKQVVGLVAFVGHEQVGIAVVVVIHPIHAARQIGLRDPGAGCDSFKAVVAFVAVEHVALVAVAVGEVHVHKAVVVVIAPGRRFRIGADIAGDRIWYVSEGRAVVAVEIVGDSIPGYHKSI